MTDKPTDLPPGVAGQNNPYHPTNVANDVIDRARKQDRADKNRAAQTGVDSSKPDEEKKQKA